MKLRISITRPFPPESNDARNVTFTLLDLRPDERELLKRFGAPPVVFVPHDEHASNSVWGGALAVRRCETLAEANAARLATGRAFERAVSDLKRAAQEEMRLVGDDLDFHA